MKKNTEGNKRVIVKINRQRQLREEIELKDAKIKELEERLEKQNVEYLSSLEGLKKNFTSKANEIKNQFADEKRKKLLKGIGLLLIEIENIVESEEPLIIGKIPDQYS